ncbi:MAG TPA: GNAT family N-acetyltransferase [Rudaea sp.]
MSALETSQNASAELRVRAATPADRAFVMHAAAHLVDFAVPTGLDVALIRTVDARELSAVFALSKPGEAIFIAEQSDGQPIGFLHVGEREDFYRGPCAHVGDVVVLPEARGQGAGRALLEAARRWAVEHGYSCMTLSVFAENLAARHLYETLGFVAETVRMVMPACSSDDR